MGNFLARINRPAPHGGRGMDRLPIEEPGGEAYIIRETF